MKQIKSLQELLSSSDKKFQERSLKIKLLKLLIVMGIFASIIGIIVNTSLEYRISSILIHVIGLALLISMFILMENKISLETVSIIIFSYYCYIYSPLCWFYEGVFGSVPFVSFVFGAFIVLLLNDTWGHDVGDRCLIGFSNFIKELLGKNGILGRIGGDEFIIIVPDKNKDETQVLGIDLTNKLEKLYLNPPSTLEVGDSFS